MAVMDALRSSVRALIGLLFTAAAIYLFSHLKAQKNAVSNERPKSKSKKKKRAVKKASPVSAVGDKEASEEGEDEGNGPVEQSVSRSVVVVEADVEGEEKQAETQKTQRKLVGAEVEARWQSGNEWFPGRIVKKHDDGSFTVDYDDGEKELKVSPGLVRLRGATTNLAGEPSGGATSSEESKQAIDVAGGQSFVGSIYEDVDERGEEYQFEVRDQADDDWQVVTTHKPTRTVEERKEQQIAASHNSKNRKKREKKREHELLVREMQRNSTA